MAKLTAKKRNALPSASFAGPGHSFPINDETHARNALARAAQFHPELKARIKAKVRRKFPSIAIDGTAPKHRADRIARKP
jgi:hypothetical protein